MNPVVHFEIPAEDRNRIVDFYTHVFGLAGTDVRTGDGELCGGDDSRC